MNAVDNLTLATQNPNRAAGALLAAGLLIALLALIIMIFSGTTPGFSAMLQGSFSEVAPYADTMRLLSLLFAISWIVQLLGFGLLTRLLVHTGHEQLAILSFILILVATLLAVLYTTFRMSVELWVAQEAALTGNVPTFFEPLKTWTSSFFRLAYAVHLLGLIGFGWGILRTGLLPPSVSQVAIGWSMLWLIGILLGVGAPAIPIIMPAVIGVALIMQTN